MDDIGNIIYLILIVLAGVSSLFKKKKNAKPIVTSDPEPHNSWEQIREELEEISKEYKEKKSFEQPIVVQTEANHSVEIPQGSLETISADEPFSYDKSYNNVKKQSYPSRKQSFFNEIKSNDIFESDEEIKKQSSIQFNNIEEVRKAIIYNEILTRKYD